MFSAACLCNGVNFSVDAQPIVASCCHCKNCKKYTGTAFTTNLVFPAGTLRVTKGEDLIKLYHDPAQDSGNALDRHFCSNCGSPLFNLNGDFGKTLAVFCGALEDWDHRAPQIEYYSKDREQWVAEITGAEQATTKPGRDSK
ncbi:hypothetical protein BD410DRAFT_783871 [Rickenella mellea]|uniref:CENP-V/GFA domain-containing protein n=1 Tax=Rickenella mellea TaxID=50990 RepID=A0A4Y7QF55_9AGAM|nr:hypothetical protein BD410DRAFT_783871 [Rickenella mellea]